MKRFSPIALAVAIVVQIIFELSTFRHSSLGFSFLVRVVFMIGFIGLLLLGDRWKWLAPALRGLIGLNFGLAVGDRFGLLGHYGSPGVAWGDFGHFIAYTRQVNSFLPAGIAPFLAVAATISEIVLSVTLVFGIAPRIACMGAALLLLAYAIAMSVSFGFSSQLYYSVLELCTGAWYLSTIVYNKAQATTDPIEPHFSLRG